MAKRIKIFLLAAEGVSNQGIARRAGVSRSTVLTWRKRFEAENPGTLWKIRPGRGRKRSTSDEKVQAIVKDTLENKPEGATHWSLRTMARRRMVVEGLVVEGARSESRRMTERHGHAPTCRAPGASRRPSRRC